jgi:hypothetical protein
MRIEKAIKDKGHILLTGSIFCLLIVFGCSEKQRNNPWEFSEENLTYDDTGQKKTQIDEGRELEDDNEIWEDFQLKLRDPKQVVKVVPKSSMPYYQLAQAFDQNDLPEFYEILNDNNSSGYERYQAIHFIGQISDKGNQEAAKVLMDYVQKKEEGWDKWKQDARYLALSKSIALSWLGYVGGRDVEGFLKKAMTPEGVREIAQSWYKEVPESVSSEEALLSRLRGFAAKGLAYSDDFTVHELIRAEYEIERQACLDEGKTSGAYLGQLIEATTRIDIIKNIGVEGHKALSDGKGSYANMYLKYQVKYLLIKPTIDFNDVKIQF